MKILNVTNLALKNCKTIRFGRFLDERGYFSEIFQSSSFINHPDLLEFKVVNFSQFNESFSKANVLRGLHFQWNPVMGKLVRPISGRLIDLILDVKKNSPTFGKIIAVELFASSDKDFSEWVWVPPGYAHGMFLPEGGLVEYFCTSEYNPLCEAGIYPLAKDLDWSLCDKNLKAEFESRRSQFIISEKDRQGLSLAAWSEDERSNNFI